MAANQEHKLVEALGDRIARAVLAKFDADAVTVTVRKPTPIAGVLRHAGVRVTAHAAKTSADAAIALSSADPRACPRSSRMDRRRADVAPVDPSPPASSPRCRRTSGSRSRARASSSWRGRRARSTPSAREIDALTRGEAETLSNEAKELSKFFGIYKQQARGERGKKTDDYFFMVRIKAPAGGDFSPAQWAALDEAAEKFADGTLRITSRQGIQYHHVYGPKLAPLVRFLNRHYRDAATLGACGDVNRNVMCSPVEGLDPEHPHGRPRARASRSPRSSRRARAPTSRCSCPTTRAATSRR